jgi:hypothetical protein
MDLLIVGKPACYYHHLYVRSIHSPAFTRDRLPDMRPNVTRHRYMTKGAVATKHQKYMMPKTMEAPVPKKRTEKRDESSMEHPSFRGRTIRGWNEQTHWRNVQ